MCFSTGINLQHTGNTVRYFSIYQSTNLWLVLSFSAVFLVKAFLQATNNTQIYISDILVDLKICGFKFEFDQALHKFFIKLMSVQIMYPTNMLKEVEVHPLPTEKLIHKLV